MECWRIVLEVGVMLVGLLEALLCCLIFLIFVAVVATVVVGVPVVLLGVLFLPLAAVVGPVFGMLEILGIFVILPIFVTEAVFLVLLMLCGFDALPVLVFVV